jgi:hypothetical protein
MKKLQTFIALALALAFTACSPAAAQTSEEMAEFKRRAQSADFMATTERMVDAVGRESCTEFNSQATAHSWFVCLGGARKTAEDLARRSLEQDGMLPPASARPEFIDRALFTHCKRHLDEPFLPNDYTVCKHGVENALAVVAKHSKKPAKSARAK